MKTLSSLSISTLICLTGCVAQPEPTPTPSAPAAQPSPLTQNALDSDCQATQIESDATLLESLGEKANPENWKDIPPDAVVASTYLRLFKTEAGWKAFQTFSGPVTKVLMKPAEGLLQFSLMSSEKCGVQRTLSVWKDEEAMMQFVTSEAHLNAMSNVSQVSRGGSITGKWQVKTLKTISWSTVAEGFSGHQGPVY